MAPYTSPLSKKLREVSSLRFELRHALNRTRWSALDLERDEWAEQARIIRWMLIDAEEEARRLEYDISDRMETALRASLEASEKRMAQQSFYRPTLNY